MNTIGKRIEHYLNIKNGGNQSELARYCGLSPQAVQKWMADDSEPRGKNLQLAAEFLNVTQVELKFGSQPTSNQNIQQAPLGSRKIPLISYVQAGAMAEVVDPYQVGDGSEYLLTDLDLGANAFALQIKGDSMFPEFKEGDRIIIDPSLSPLPGDFVVAKNGHEEATFKKYRPRGINDHGNDVFELVPLNDDYAPMRSDVTPLRIIGVMVEHRKYRRR
jgi:SOS-response transcriptional repressor LexA